MMIVTLASQKGGAGKTTLVQNLARAAHEAGKKSIIIDLDPQMTSLRQYDKRKAKIDDHQPETVAAKVKDLRELINFAEGQGVDIVWLDLPPNIGDESLYITKLTDFLLIATQPQAFDLEAIEATISIAKAVGARGAVVINRDPIGKKSRGQDAADYITQHCDFPLAPHIIGDREQFMDASIHGQSVLISDPKTAAAKEVRALYGWVEERLENISKEKVAA